MNAVKQSCRPKHQVLIIKCYPRFQKNAAEVKPNSSELSYLLYYASTRRSKLQKVGSYLEKKVASDVSKNKIGNVQVTLQIVKALIEKLPRELPLYASYVLKILGDVLGSKDLSMVEESIPTFETFCQHYDVATLAADQDHVVKYENLVRIYSSYAALKTPVQPKGGLSPPIAIRWRTAGLRALKSITASEAIGADGGRQMNFIIPVILQNLQSGDESHLLSLQQNAREADSTEKEQAMRRRMSVATVRTTDEGSRPSSAAVAGTADDADKIAEEAVGLQAFQSLKQIFVANNRVQIRLATGAMLKFICTVPVKRPTTSRSVKSVSSGTWATALVEMVTRWAPVQDRFVIVVTIMEALIRSPVAEENLEQQLLLVSLVRWLLRSTINMIGLSVMDVLLGLIHHILLLLQLGGKGSSILPHHQQTDAIDIFKGTDSIATAAPPPAGKKEAVQSEESSPSSNRQELLVRLQKCIGDLATHIYYSDQISDIITAILQRLKPSPKSGIATAAIAIEDPQAAANAISISAQLRENPETDEFFSFGTARVTALKAIMEVLNVANTRRASSGAAAIGRNRVGVQIWDGTQWLLRDEDRRVRRAYVDALLTWLKLEMSSNDLRVLEDKRKLLRDASKIDVGAGRRENLTRRAVSNASHRENAGKPAKSTFLQLLHLAIYDNALESPESEPDISLLHLLLYQLVEKLGVNAVKTGLPMIMRLQEDINDDDQICSPAAKLNVGTLVHGYFWILSEKFNFDNSTAGYTIRTEISRRKSHGLWLETVQMPPIPVDQIMSSKTAALSEKPPDSALQTESIKPFDDRAAMVDRIAEAYANAVASPPTSPPASPGRVFSMPILSAVGPRSSSNNDLPEKIKDAMLSDWSKNICIATVDKETARTISLSGSRNGTNLSKYLGINGQGVRNGSPNGGHSPASGLPLDGDVSQAQPLNFAFQHSNSPDDSLPTPISSSDQNSTLRVDDLKRVLAGGSITSARNASPLRHTASKHYYALSSDKHSSSSSSDSVASASGFDSVSEVDFAQHLPPLAPHSLSIQKEKIKPAAISTTHPNNTTSATHSRNTSSHTHPRSRPQSMSSDPNKPSTPRSLRRPSTSSSAAGEDPDLNAAALRGEMPRLSVEFEDEVPPVPPLPAGVAPAPRPLSGAFPIGQMYLSNEKEKEKRPGSAIERGDGKSNASSGSRIGRAGKRSVDVEKLLGSIDAVTGGERGFGVGRPPY